MVRLPTKADFPPDVALTINPPPPNSPRTTNVLILLHGLGDTHALFATLGTQMRLPETTTIALRAPQPVPFVPGFHWGDDIIFDTGGGGALDPDAGFKGATDYLGKVIEVLVQRCGYRPREVFLMGYGQGGMAGLAVAEAARRRGWWELPEGAEDAVTVRRATEGSTGATSEAATGQEAKPRRVRHELGGVVSIGGGLPESSLSSRGTGKSPTPVLVCGGSSESALTAGALSALRDAFESVEHACWGSKGDWMPKNKGEMMPVMRFFARRLRSRAGVPEGAVEIG